MNDTYPKARIIERQMTCLLECAHCGEEMLWESEESYLIDGIAIICPLCGKMSYIDTADYLCQHN